jgi:hypothetical protein
MLSHQLLLLLPLLKEFQLGYDPRDLALIHDVHLRDIQHYEQKVKLAHGCVLENDEGRDILLDVLGNVLIVEIDRGVPETLQLLLLSEELKWRVDTFSVLAAQVALIFLRGGSFGLANLLKLCDLKLLMMNECNKRL